ncbi:hypothetical protein BS50DRAFT_639440 [Corynespora cassiicola Philippines]|uniref:Rhodopsin domain-containing protein n=1 Tax=Corynespora cassiicola Philippines TaxID=1448308 RepID=A0A2T2N6X4_CORCC|nr:hypothetical protein BS50DRAFT_639440 [Corynespora cassiicola Philippines]
MADSDSEMSRAFVDTSLLGVAISLPIIASAAVGLRFYARTSKVKGMLKIDDWAVFITLIVCWGHSINTIVAGAIGGVNTITIPPREYANVALRTLWISTFFLITALYSVKISILSFYYIIFSVNYRFKQACIFMMCVLTLWWVSALILVFLSTDPFDAAWKNAASAKHRFDFNAWYISYSALSIFFDLAILCFPIPMIKSLQVNTKQKISILGIFWLGGFVCVSAIIRFVFLYNSIYRLTDYGKNQYSNITTAFIWAEVEPNTSVVAACLPTYGPLFKENKLFTRVYRSLRSPFGGSKDSRSAEKADTRASGYYPLSREAPS